MTLINILLLLFSPSFIPQQWDIAGHEKFGTSVKAYYRFAMAVFVVFDMTRKATLEKVLEVCFPLLFHFPSSRIVFLAPFSSSTFLILYVFRTHHIQESKSELCRRFNSRTHIFFSVVVSIAVVVEEQYQ